MSPCRPRARAGHGKPGPSGPQHEAHRPKVSASPLVPSILKCDIRFTWRWAAVGRPPRWAGWRGVPCFVVPRRVVDVATTSCRRLAGAVGALWNTQGSQSGYVEADWGPSGPVRSRCLARLLYNGIIEAANRQHGTLRRATTARLGKGGHKPSAATSLQDRHRRTAAHATPAGPPRHRCRSGQGAALCGMACCSVPRRATVYVAAASSLLELCAILRSASCVAKTAWQYETKGI